MDRITNIENSGEVNAMEEIAVIGMAGRFPGARNIDDFWENLRKGVNSVSRFTDQELDSFGVPRETYKHPNFVKSRPARSAGAGSTCSGTS